MSSFHAEPWLPPAEPSLAHLAMEAADREGLGSLRAWPEIRGNGVRLGELPTFACWKAFQSGWHLVLLQPREVGALVPGARMEALPGDWLASLDLEALARPLAIHPDFPGGAGVHVLRLPAPGRAEWRGMALAPREVLEEVLRCLTGVRGWNFEG
jgi:hypothetical protein